MTSLVRPCGNRTRTVLTSVFIEGDSSFVSHCFLINARSQHISFDTVQSPQLHTQLIVSIVISPCKPLRMPPVTSCECSYPLVPAILQATHTHTHTITSNHGYQPRLRNVPPPNSLLRAQALTLPATATATTRPKSAKTLSRR